MAIFTNKTSTYDDFELPVVEGYEAETNGNMDACIECFEDQLAVIEAMHALDLAEMKLGAKITAMREADEDAEEIEEAEKELEEVTEASLKDIWAKIREMLSKLWAKIKAFFANVVKFFDGLFLNGKKFAEKYEKQLNAVGKIDYECFIYTTDSNESVNDIKDTENGLNELISEIQNTKDESAIPELKEAMKEFTEEKDKMMDEVRAESVHKSGAIKSEDYQKELYMFFRNGKDYKEKISVDVKAVVNWLKTNKAKDTIKKFQNASDAAFNNIINKAKSAENAANREGGELGSAKASAFNAAVSVFTAFQTINNTYINAWKSAVNEQTSTYKSICVAALSKKNQKKD